MWEKDIVYEEKIKNLCTDSLYNVNQNHVKRNANFDSSIPEYFWDRRISEHEAAR